MAFLEEVDHAPLLSATAEAWTQRVHFIVDSGAAETVIPESTLRHIPTTKSDKFGARYKGIEGIIVENIGEQTLHGNVDAQAARITAQVCHVSKPLYSVVQAVRAGHDVTFRQDGGNMRHRDTGP